LLTAEPPLSRGATRTHEPRGVRHRFQGTIHLGGVLAAFLAALLAFGLLGLLAGFWHLRRGRRSAHSARRCCRRRRGLALAGTFALAGLALAGAGMAVHQHLNGPGLPHCGQQLTRPVTAHPDDPVEEEVGSVWLQTRQVLTAPVSGLARHYLNDRGGGLCEAGSLTLAFLPSAASDSPFAVGSIVVTGDQAEMREGKRKALASHESRHVSQWATLTLLGGPSAMPLLYAADDAFYPHARNHFERAADLDDGGYSHPEDFGPRPQWAKVGAIGMLLLAIGWRRLRWTSRVLTGGAAAATAHQHGLCPLHSRGWFRPQTNKPEGTTSTPPDPPDHDAHGNPPPSPSAAGELKNRRPGWAHP